MLGVLAFFSLVAVWSTTLSRIDLEYRLEVQSIERNTSNLARAFEENVRNHLQQINTVLQFIQRRYQQTDQVTDSMVELLRIVRTSPTDQVALIDANGKVVFHTLPGLTLRNLADRDYFKVHQGSPNAGLFIDKPITGLLTSTQVIILSRRLETLDGRFAGVVSFGLNPADFAEFFKKMQLGSEYSISLTGRDGIVRIRHTGSKIFVGEDLSRGTLFSELQKAEAGYYRTASVLDGVNRFFSYRTVEGHPLIVAVGVAESEALSDFYQRRTGYYTRAGIASIAICFVIGVFGIFLKRRVKDAKLQKGLYHLSEAATADTSDDFYLSVRQILQDMLQAKNFYIGLCDPARTKIYYPLQVDEKEILSDGRSFSAGLCEYVIRTEQPLLGSPQKIAKLEATEGVTRHPPMGVQWMGVPLRDSDGIVFGVIVVKSYQEIPVFSTSDFEALKFIANQVAMSISRKRIQQALRYSNEKYMKAYYVSPDAVNINRLSDGLYLDINLGFTKLTGYTRDEVIGKTSIELNLWANSEDRKTLAKMLAENGEIVDYEAEFRVKDSSIRVCLMSANLIEIDGENCILSVTRDITERRKTEKELLASEDMLSKVFHASHDSIAVVRLSDGFFYKVNESYCRITGYKMSEVVGHTALELSIWANPEERPKYIALLEEHGVVKFEALMRRKDGSNCLCELSWRTIEIGGIPCSVGIMTDITERRQAELELAEYRKNLEALVAKRTEELQNANKELEAFSYSVSHDLRAPVRAIHAFSSSLLESITDHLDATELDELKRIKNNAEKMGNLIDALLQLSRVGRIPTTIHRVSLSKLVEESIKDCQALESGRNVEVVITPGLSAFGDSQLLRIFFANLIGNAWKYTSKKAAAKIEFGSAVVEDKIVYYVRDNGAGFDMEFVDKLFTPFQRLHRAGEFPGTGIGLAIMARIIQRHEGKIWAEGEVEKGATFYFTLGGQEARSFSD